jgi:(p)ppGpp synthase/HD superfamily hydrolase
MNMSANMMARALLLAGEAHAGQVRKYTGEPYINLCFVVAGIVASVGGTDAMIAAAFLHDTVEDTDTTLAELENDFGLEVSYLVHQVTDASKPSDGNRARRKEIDREFLSRASAAAQTIKLADIISNTSSIVARDPNFAVVYLREKALLLPLLTKGDPTLFARAAASIPRLAA